MEREYRILKARWRDGERDRELALQLMFLAWWHWAEPPFLTHLIEDADVGALWHEVFDYFGGETSADVEFQFVAGLMAHLFPYVLGDETEWESRGSRMIERAMAVQPTGLPLNTFDDRSEYGRYFSHQLRGHLNAR